MIYKNSKNLSTVWKLFILFSLLFSSICLGNPREIYPFNSSAEKAQFQELIQVLRCLVCQNQTIADSNAPLAIDLRQIIYQKIKKGESEEAIKNYLVTRYGEYILFKPPVLPITYLLWFGPFILLFIVVIKFLRRNQFLKVNQADKLK